MNLSKFSLPFFAWRLIAFAVITTGISAARIQAREAGVGPQQKTFVSPEAAMNALVEAAKTGDHAALHELFGPDATNMLTGDQVQDAANFKAFSQAVAEKCVPRGEGENKVILNLGAEDWPFPIPLVKQDGVWRFDVEAGREEIINRHVGRDELNAIGVCRSYVEAQKQYFNEDPEGSGIHRYARKFKSSPGKKDGLYWPAEGASKPSPFGLLVAEAHAEGYGHKANGAGRQPFHGYLFKILTRQGRSAPGGKANYVVHGNLTAGFALAAWPARWDQSGIMTFIVNQDGRIYQRNLGEKTASLAARMTEYDPDDAWAPVQDQGINEK